LSMLKVDESLLGFRYTKWHDCPTSPVSNGRVRSVVHTYSDIENVIHTYAWPMDSGKFNIAGGWALGLQWQIDPATPPVPNGQNWKSSLMGFLEDSGIHFHRFTKSASQNTFFPTGLEVEAYEYCPNGIEPQFMPFFEFANEHAPYFEYLPETDSYSSLGQGPAPAALTIRFLKKLYSLMADKDTYKDRIKTLADYLLGSQCTDSGKNWYGGFISHTGTDYYYSIDAAFAGEALLDAYELWNDQAYLDGAVRSAAFLRHMQTRHLVGLVDQYYGGFCEYVRSSNGAYLTRMYVKLLLALPFLKRLYEVTGNSLYNTMAVDARSFLVGTTGALMGHYEYYDPQPYGDNQWHREIGSLEEEKVVYADSYAYALRGLYEYEGLTQTVRDVYDYIQSITGTRYDPKIAWAGYLDVVNNKPDCSYYDMVTAGLLVKIRMEYDRASLPTSFNWIIARGSVAFYFAVNFDGTPTPGMKQHTSTVAGLGWGFSQLDLGISKDLMILLFHFKNVGASPLSFYFGVYTASYSGYTGTEKYVHPDYSALVKSDGKTIIWGSDTAPQDCYMDGAWRTSDYSDTMPDSNWLRWNLTLNAGAEKFLAYIIIYGDSENGAISNKNVIKSWDHVDLLRKEVRFWRNWLNEGKLYSCGVWEIDQLAKINLCHVKSFMSQDNYGLPASTGPGYPNNHWPVDSWTCYWALTLWGHLDEAKDYFGTFVKKTTEYIKANSLNLYKAIHICLLTDFKPTSPISNYTAEDCFLLPIVAVETWKKAKGDATFRDNLWSWIQTFMDEIDGDLVAYGDWKDHFDHVNIWDAFESWIFIIPHSKYGNNSMVVMPVNALLARCYEQIADLAEAKGEHSKASTWRSRAKTILSKFYDFWTVDKKATYHYWGDVTGYGNTQSWPSWDNMKHEPLPDKPQSTLSLSWISDMKDETVRKCVQLYYDNYLAYYSGLVACDPADNWMYGKVERRSTYGDKTGFDKDLWDIFVAAAYLGFDDIIEEFFSRLRKKYSPARNGLFDEDSTWEADAQNGYHMTRAMGMFLLGFAFLFNRLDPVPVKKFLLRLHDRGKEVTILKQTGTVTDQFGNLVQSFEPVCITKAIVRSYRGAEQVVQAGFASIDNRIIFFKPFTPVDVGHRIRINDVDYAVETITRHHYKSRMINKEVFATRVIP